MGGRSSGGSAGEIVCSETHQELYPIAPHPPLQALTIVMLLLMGVTVLPQLVFRPVGAGTLESVGLAGILIASQ